MSMIIENVYNLILQEMVQGYYHGLFYICIYMSWFFVIFTKEWINCIWTSCLSICLFVFAKQQTEFLIVFLWKQAKLYVGLMTGHQPNYCGLWDSATENRVFFMSDILSVEKGKWMEMRVDLETAPCSKIWKSFF